MTHQVMKAEPYRYGAMGSLGDASNMLIRQYRFPDTYDDRDAMLSAYSDRCIQWDYGHATACFRRHTGTGDQGLERWAKDAPDDDVIAFLKDILKADGRSWTGYRITGTVHLGNGYAVWTLELFAKHPDSKTKTYTGPAAPNVGWHHYSRVPEHKRDFGLVDWMVGRLA